MHLSALLGSAAALVPATLSQITAPSNFLIQARSIEGVSTNNQYNKFYLGYDTVTPNVAIPLLVRISANSGLFLLTNPNVTDTGTFYTLQTNGEYSAPAWAVMNYVDPTFPRWLPVTFQVPAEGRSPNAMEYGFYLNGTQNDMQLLWTDNYETPVNGNFTAWMVCYWQFQAPQLFFIPRGEDPTKLKLPSSCEVVSLRVIPI